MLVADVLSITLAVLGFLLSLQGLWLLCRALWPRRVAAAAARCGRSPVTSFLVGLPVTALVAVAVGAAGKALGAAGQAIAFGVLCLYMVYAHTGVAGFVTHLGRRLPSPADEARPWAATVRGGVVLELAYVVPLVGWFVLLPASVILGAGAMTLSFFRIKSVPDRDGEAATPPPMPAATHGHVYTSAPAGSFAHRDPRAAEVTR
jgi:hypothetical protein